MKERTGYLILGAICALVCVAAPSPALLEEPASLITLYGLTVALAIFVSFAVWKITAQKADRTKPFFPQPSIASFLAICSFLGARVLYCLFRLPYYWDIGLYHIFLTREGGFLLYGALAGFVSGAAWIAQKRGIRISSFLDDLIIPCLSAVLLCRLGEGFAYEGLGTWVENDRFCHFPFSVLNPYGEYQWALFLLEAVYALLVMLFLTYRRKRSGKKEGYFLSALLLYAAAQICFESLRKDSSLKIGFVRVSQVLSAVSILFIVILRNRNCKRSLIAKVLLFVFCCCGIGAIEWALDKTELNTFSLYSGMILLCSLSVWAGHRTNSFNEQNHPARLKNSDNSA